MNTLFWITLEILFVTVSIILLYRLKSRFGLSLLFIFIGSNQYLETILASTVYIPIFGPYYISPGSIVLFSSSLFAILLIYIKEDVPQTRTLIYGVVLSDLTLTILSLFTKYQMEMQSTLNLLGITSALFRIDIQLFLIGTATLILDSILIIILYEVTFFKLKKVGLFGRILGTMLLVLYFDAIIFSTGGFWGKPKYWNILISQVIGNTYSGFLYGILLYFYLVYIEQNQYLQKATIPREMKDIFSILTYREKYELTRQSLEESEAKFRQVTENIREVFWMSDVGKNQMLYISPGYETIWGRSCESLYKEPRGWLEAIHPDDRNRVLEAALTKQVQGKYDEEYRIIRTDGTIRWIRDRAFPIKNKSGKIYRITGIAEDITTLKRRERINTIFAEMKHTLGEVTTPKEVAMAILKAADELFGWDAAIIELSSENGNTLRTIISMDTIDGKRVEFPGDLEGESPSPNYYSLIQQEPQLIMGDVSQQIKEGKMKRFGNKSQSASSRMYAPIRKQNKSIGLITIQSYTPNLYTKQDLVIFGKLAEACGGALVRTFTESALREGEERFLNIFEKVQLGIAIVDMNHRYVKTNPKLCEMLGYTEKELHNFTFIELTHPEDRKKDLELCNKVILGELDYCTLEKRFIKKNKEIIWVNAIGTVVRAEDGKPLYGIGLLEDITKRKRTEKTNLVFGEMKWKLGNVKSSKEVTTVILDAADQLFGWDASAVDILSNDELKVNTLVCIDTVDGKKQEFPPGFEGRYLSPIFQKTLQDGSQLILRSESFSNHINLLPFGDKIRKSASLMYVPIRKHNKNIGILTIQSYQPNAYTKEDLEVLQWLGERCGTALEQAYAEAVAQENEQRFRKVFEESHFGMVIMDSNFHFIKVNKSLCQMLGYTEEELLQLTFPEITHPDDIDVDIDIAKKIFSGEISHGTREKRYIKKNKESIWVNLTRSVVRDETGKPLYGLGIVEDLTERKKAEEERKRLTEELFQKQKMAAVGETIETITHNMKNILTALNGSLTLIENAYLEKNWNLMEKSMDLLHSSSTHLYLLLMNMLDCSKKREPNYQKIQIQPVFEDIIKMLRSTVGIKEIEFQSMIEPGSEIITSDYQYLFRNLLNLGCNAVDAITNTGTICFKSTLMSIQDLEQFFPNLSIPKENEIQKIPVIEVSDNGKGISQDMMDKIFEPFFSTKGSLGTGLGLPSVKQFMDEQGDSVLVKSSPGVKTSFFLIFLHEINNTKITRAEAFDSNITELF